MNPSLPSTDRGPTGRPPGARGAGADPASAIRPGNPFSTRYTRPGAIPYVFAPGESLGGVIERLERLGDWGQIIGPHGTGKSTLVAALLAELKHRGRPVYGIRLTAADRDRKLTAHRLDCAPGTLVVIDGFERISMMRRALWVSACRRRGVGLLVTSHRRLRMPVVFRAQTRREDFLRLVRERLEGCPALMGDDVIADCYHRHVPNLREALFELYDRWETASRDSAARDGRWPPPAADRARTGYHSCQSPDTST